MPLDGNLHPTKTSGRQYIDLKTTVTGVLTFFFVITSYPFVSDAELLHSFREVLVASCSPPRCRHKCESYRAYIF